MRNTPPLAVQFVDVAFLDTARSFIAASSRVGNKSGSNNRIKNIRIVNYINLIFRGRKINTGISQVEQKVTALEIALFPIYEYALHNI
jgi:hypothetical protein